MNRETSSISLGSSAMDVGRQVQDPELSRLVRARMDRTIANLHEDMDAQAPKTRNQCLQAPRLCPWVRFRWHMLLMTCGNPVKMLKTHTNERLSEFVAGMECSCVLKKS